MRCGVHSYNFAVVVVLRFLTASFWLPLCAAVSVPSSPGVGVLVSARDNPLNINWDPAPSPEDGPPASAGALRDPSYLPAQIGGIVGAYGLSLVVVASLLIALSKRRRDHLRAAEFGEEDPDFDPFPPPFFLQSEEEYKNAIDQFQQLSATSEHPPRNFSLPSNSPLSPTRSYPLSAGARSQHSLHTVESPTSTVLALGNDLSVDPVVVNHDRAMAQQQLEDMYKYVMEQEDARAQGKEYQGPPLPAPSTKSPPPPSPATPRALKREKNKPTSLNLSRDDKAQSRGSSILSFLKSPRKNKVPQSVSISSPIMTPMSGTFPRHEDQEMNAMQPRHYAPPPAASVHSDVLPFRRAPSNHLPTPDISPISTQSIAERIDSALAQPPTREARFARREVREEQEPSHSRDVSAATSTDREPTSAVSERSTSSTSGLVGLPMSPKPGVNRFPSLDTLPMSPKPGQTFGDTARAKNLAPVNTSISPINTTAVSATSGTSAVRPGGVLPFRAYEGSPSSPAASYSTKQTVFTRAAGPLSPGLQTGQRTPWTGAPVPYTPYQPFSPVVPITPSLVTRADRKRMKRFEPKTPTVEMVRGEDDIW
ncbi:hypothetical protein B0T26DRAFT_653861 [Lasiosphaeria miniovina]|uniref:Uncharacterized protein n=1 Tax=Lasiosphaeria miniovina TaxID=1954250 RepID=A0AA40A5D9_9PEZI|nr:uncharacterized protein B0T26DRAFT_653861 [Lasiosphaeria miniovina]KAK0709604.1 hypothetical protein B0T26DRAFT_653861 [Lasiosphaeria miniovina]